MSSTVVNTQTNNMNTNNILFNLPTEIQRKIYMYDDTYKSIYNNVLDELLLYDFDDLMEYQERVAYCYRGNGYPEVEMAIRGLSVMNNDLHIIGDEEYDKLYMALFKKFKSLLYDEYLKWKYEGWFDDVGDLWKED
jgi:hypothetical protein